MKTGWEDAAHKFDLELGRLPPELDERDPGQLVTGTRRASFEFSSMFWNGQKVAAGCVLQNSSEHRIAPKSEPGAAWQ